MLSLAFTDKSQQPGEQLEISEGALWDMLAPHPAIIKQSTDTSCIITAKSVHLR